jgi:arylsulfatase A-like enzyme
VADQVTRASRRQNAATNALVCAVLAAIVYLLLILTTFKYGRDQGIYAVVSDTILNGGAPYRDAWDFKPPLVFFVYAAARGLLGTGMESIRIAEAMGLASLVVAFAILSRRLVGDWRAGILGAALATLVHVQLEFWHTAQPESFGGIVTAWALVFATYEPAAKHRCLQWTQLAAWAMAGALYTIAALLKPPLGGGFVVSLLFVLYQQLRVLARRDRLRRLGAVCLAFAVGGAVVVASVFLFFFARRALGEVHDTFFVFVPEYTALGFEPRWLPVLLWKAVVDALTSFSALLPLGLILFVVLRSRTLNELGGAAHILGVVFFQLLGVALQAKFFDYHYGATLPLLALLAGWGFWKLWLRLFTEPLRAASAALFIGVILLASPKRTTESGISLAEALQVRTQMLLGRAKPEDVDRLHSLGDVSFGANLEMARWLEEHVRTSEKVFIWGFEPVVYDMASREPASRYIYNVPQRLEWPGADAARRELIDELTRARPGVILVLRNDVFRDVVGDARDSVGALRRFPELSELIEKDYRLDGRIGDFTVYARRPRASRSPERQPTLATCVDCNVLLVSIDTLRADHLSCYGYDRQTTPEICAFFAAGTRFERAYSQSSWTAPAHASMFTGLYPARHGVTYGPLIPLLRGHPTIFEQLRRHGYFTAALYGGGYVNPVMPNDQLDFERIVELRQDLVGHFEDSLRGNTGDKPFFVFLHGYDVHTPYAPRRNHFADPRPEIDEQARKNAYCRYEDAEDKSRSLAPSSVPSDLATQRYLESLYDSELLEVDRSLGKLFRHLEASGLLGRTLIILTSDHGEEFWDHGSCEHVKTVYNELIHVPLFVRGPGIDPEVETRPVAASIDIAPTITEALGVPPLDSIDGRALFEAGPREIFSEAQFHYASRHLRRYSVIADSTKLIRNFDPDAHELYELEEDPGERRDVLKTEPAPPNLESTLEGYIGQGAPVEQQEGELDSQTLEQLRRLGYIE